MWFSCAHKLWELSANSDWDNLYFSFYDSLQCFQLKEKLHRLITQVSPSCRGSHNNLLVYPIFPPHAQNSNNYITVWSIAHHHLLQNSWILWLGCGFGTCLKMIKGFLSWEFEQIELISAITFCRLVRGNDSNISVRKQKGFILIPWQCCHSFIVNCNTANILTRKIVWLFHPIKVSNKRSISQCVQPRPQPVSALMNTSSGPNGKSYSRCSSHTPNSQLQIQLLR